MEQCKNVYQEIASKYMSDSKKDSETFCTKNFTEEVSKIASKMRSSFNTKEDFVNFMKANLGDFIGIFTHFQDIIPKVTQSDNIESVFENTLANLLNKEYAKISEKSLNVPKDAPSSLSEQALETEKKTKGWEGIELKYRILIILGVSVIIAFVICLAIMEYITRKTKYNQI